MTPHNVIRAENQIDRWFYDGDPDIPVAYRDGDVVFTIPSNYGGAEEVTISVPIIREAIKKFKEEDQQAIKAEINAAISTWEEDGFPPGKVISREQRECSCGSFFTGYGQKIQWFARIEVSEMTPTWNGDIPGKTYQQGEIMEVPCRAIQEKI